MLIGTVAEGLLLGNYVTVVETATAVDATTTGNVLFATLIDAPASAHETLDAYLGEIMLETANADATISAGVLYVAEIVEETTAGDAARSPPSFIADIEEVTTADCTQDAATISGDTTITGLVGDEFSVLFVTVPPANVTILDSGTVLTVQ